MDKRTSVLNVPSTQDNPRSRTNSSIKENAEDKRQQARTRWDMVRIQVNQGYFKVSQKESVDLSDFATAVETLWEDAHRYSGVQVNPETDSTVEFITRLNSNYTGKKPQRRAGIVDALSKARRKSLDYELHHEPEFKKELLKRSWGFGGVSFDCIPNCDINDNMFAVSKGLVKRDPGDSTQKSVHQFQILLNRGWKLLLIGMKQGEAFARYEAMVDTGRSFPHMLGVLNDSQTRNEIGECLMNISVADERRENRIKAIYLMGQYAFYLGSVSECHAILARTLIHLIKEILETQYIRKNGTECNFDDIRLHIIRAIAKFTGVPFGKKYQVLVIYMIHRELSIIFQKKNDLVATDPNVFVILAILDMLNNNIPKTTEYQCFVGALFQPFIKTLIESTCLFLQRAAIQFVCNWMPIKNEDALLIGYDKLLDGIKESKILDCTNFSEPFYLSEMKELLQSRHIEECRVSLKDKLMRSLIQPPGTTANLLPVPGLSGFFCDLNTNMRKTRSILVELPIHAKSNVSLTRPIPSIPGIPSAVTTVPPLIIPGDKWADVRNVPRSQYEYKERTGGIPKLPPGYTYAPLVNSFANKTSSPVGFGLERLRVPKDVSAWKDIDELPKGAARTPVLTEADRDGRDGSTCPTGFSLVCTYPGFDPERVDRSVVAISSIYGRPVYQKSKKKQLSSDINNSGTPAAFSSDKIHYQDYSSVGAIENPDTAFVIPPDTTLNRHPVLFPCRIPKLKSNEPEHDFLKGAPVILDIIQPTYPTLQRILTVVEALNEDASNIIVHKSANDIGGLYAGARFNIYVKLRDGSDKWHVVQLKVIDENYEDAVDLSSPNQAEPLKSYRSEISRRMSFIPSVQEVFSTPIPSNYTDIGEPYFAPPVNLPPTPIGYNSCVLPYYGKSSNPRPQPAGISPNGARYYSADSNHSSVDPNLKNLFAGYDCDGNPFYIPRSLVIPSPSGFSIDGIPYYDIPTLIRQPGYFALPPLLRGDYRIAQESDDWEDLLVLLQNTMEDNVLLYRRLEVRLQSKLISQVASTNSALAQRLTASKNRVLNPFQNKVGNLLPGLFVPPDDFGTVRDPIDVASFLRESLSFAHLQPQPIKIMLEPSTCDFHSARSPTTKTLSLRFKAGRGDYTEREYFLAVEPPNVFFVKECSFKLQGEGIHEISVTYYPLAMKAYTEEGRLYVFDKFGRKMTSSRLNAVRRKFIKVESTQLDVGWILPGKKKEANLVIENLADYPIVVVVQPPKATVDEIDDGSTESSFFTPVENLKLKALESTKLPIWFQPKVPVIAKETMKLLGPGGEEVIINLYGTTDIPMSVYAENDENSRLGTTTLSIERTQLIKKLDKKSVATDFMGAQMSAEDKVILTAITQESNAFGQDNSAHLLDFGICCPNNSPAMRCLTIFNWGTNPILCGLYSHEKTITCTPLVRVAPKSACSIEIVFEFNSGKKPIRGNFSSVIEISCQDFENIPIRTKAFIGQPFYIPNWSYIFFKPCRLEQTSQINTSIINESHYVLQVKVEGLHEKDAKYGFKSNQFPTRDSVLEVQEHSILPWMVTFVPERTGPQMTKIRFHILKPNKVEFAAGMREQEIYLIGSVIQPRKGIEDSTVQPALEQYIKWITQSRGTYGVAYPEEADFADDKADIEELPFDAISEVVFKADPYYPDIPGDFSSRNHPVAAQNRGTTSKKVRFFGSTGFNFEPKLKELEPGELLKLDNFFSPPPEVGNMVSVIGFAAAVDLSNSFANATQIIKRLSLAFLVLPFQNYVEQQYIMDFGNIEINGDCNSKATKYLLLCNPFHFKYKWSIKFAASSRKTLAFEVPFLTGELSGLRNLPLPINFSTDVSGTYETKCDLFVDPPDQFNKSIRLGTITFRGTAVYSKVYGMPESIDFGSTIVYHSSKRRFTLQNEGSREAEVNSLARTPFVLKPSKFTIPAKSSQQVEVIFSPAEHRLVKSKIQLFINQTLRVIEVTGSGGNALLCCQEFGEKPIDLGLQKDGNIVWASIYLTNNGSIPLKITSIASDTPKKLRIEYNTIVKVIPLSQEKKLTIRKDYWKLIRRKIKVFKFMRSTVKVFNGKLASTSDKPIGRSDIKVVEIYDLLEYDPAKVDVNLPELKPMHSYQFRVGYPVAYHDEHTRQLSFCYQPLCEMSEGTTVENFVETLTLEITCDVFLPLEIKPLALDFGILPAECYVDQNAVKNAKGSYGVTNQIELQMAKYSLKLNVTNESSVPLTLALHKINPEFTIHGRNWTVEAGTKMELPVEFHPPREQTQYIGEAVFIHKYGEMTVNLCGTGASAELIVDQSIDFGSLKLDSVATRTISLHNRGIIPCQFELDIVQKDKDFWFKDGDPSEFVGELQSGQHLTKEIVCQCRKKSASGGSIVVRWKKVPLGKQEKIIVPMKLHLGYPEFKFEMPDLNFRTTYIGIGKICVARIYNDGNAACAWKALPDLPSLTMETTSGVLEPGQVTQIKIKYSPLDFETLDSSILFTTEAGLIKLPCSGVVGVPYLKFESEMRQLDFGVVTVGQQHYQFLDVTNTGPNPIDFEITWLDMKKNDEICPKEDFDFFYIEPNVGTIKGKETLSMKVIVQPKEYAILYQAEFMMRSAEGEQHSFKLKAVGGQAIVKLSAPKPVAGSKNRVSTAVAESRPKRKVKKAPLPGEPVKYLMRTHIDNLYEVVAGIRTAEQDMIDQVSKSDNSELSKKMQAIQENVDPNVRDYELLSSKNEEIGAPKAASYREAAINAYRNRNVPPPNKELLATLSKMEEQVNDALKKLGVASPEEQQFNRRRSRLSSIMAEETELTPRPPTTGSPSTFGSYTPSFSRRMRRLVSSLEQSSGTSTSISKSSGLPTSGERSSISRSSFSAGISSSEIPALKAETDVLLPPVSTSEKHTPDVSNSTPGTGSERIASEPLDSADEPIASLQPVGLQHLQEIQSIISNEEVLMSFLELEGTKKNFEKLLEFSKTMGLPENLAEANPQLVQNVNTMLHECINTTKAAIKAAKETLAQETWIPNREIITHALRKLQMSAHALDNVVKGKQEEVEEQEENNVYNLGLVGGGDVSQPTLLFMLPNNGNIAFPFNLVPNPDDSTKPNGVDNNIFILDPNNGCLEPGQVAEIVATIEGTVSGSYRQGFFLKSGTETVASFSVIGSIGNPILKLVPELVDFGLVGVNQANAKQILIKNSGTFEGTWEFVVERELSSALKFTPSSGKTEASSSTKINVTFKAPKQQTWEKIIYLNWKNGKLPFTIKAEGGESKIEVEYPTKYPGINFGSVLVGLRKEVKLLFKNSGNMESKLTIAHPNQSILIQTTRNENNEIVLLPKSEIPITFSYVPMAVETIKETIVVGCSNNRAGFVNIEILGESQTQSWDVIGTLDFINERVDSIQEKEIIIRNTGTSNISPDVKFVPTELSNIFEVKYLDWSPSQPLKPGSVARIILIIQYAGELRVEGKLVLKSKILEAEDEKVFPFDFKIYEEEIEAQILDDIDLGRKPAGETAEATQIVINNGNRRVRYRATIENDEVGVWEIEENAEGILDPNSSIAIKAIYKAKDRYGDEWQKAHLVVEKNEGNTEDGWVLFSKIGLKAGVGIPKFEARPSSIYFSDTAVHCSTSFDGILANTGTAETTYEFPSLPPPFYFDGQFQLNGVIPVDGEIKYKVYFRPEKEDYYSSEVTVVTPIGEFVISFTGQSWDTKIDDSKIPKEIDFGQIPIGSFKEKEFELINQSRLNTKFHIGWDTEDGPANGFVIVAPNGEFQLGGSFPDTEAENSYRNSILIVLKCGVLPLQRSNGKVDLTWFSTFELGKVFKDVLLLSANNSVFHPITLSYSFAILPVKLLKFEDDVDEVEKSITHFDFGKAALDFGLSKTIVLHNLNSFKLSFKINLIDEEKQFEISPQEFDLDGNDNQELALKLLPLKDSKFDLDGPAKNSFFSAKLLIMSDLTLISPISVQLSGTLADIGESIVVAETVDFPDTFENHYCTSSLSFTNTTLRQISWELDIEEGFRDIFTCIGAKSGKVPSKESITIMIKFRPKTGVNFDVQAYVHIDDQVHRVKLRANGVTPHIHASTNGGSFGIVGIMEPEYREVTLTNTTVLPMRLRPKSDNECFAALEKDLVVYPGQSSILHILFSPKVANVSEKGKITLYHVNESDEELTDAPLENITWTGILKTEASEDGESHDFGFDGTGGKFGFKLTGEDVQEQVVFAPIALGDTKVNMNFGSIKANKKYRKSFEVENSGETNLEFAAMDLKENVFTSNINYQSPDGILSFSLSPTESKISPKSKAKITLMIEGIRDGEAKLEFQIKTRNLVLNKVVSINVTATIHTPSEMESLRAFLRAEDNLDTKYNLQVQEAKYITTDKMLWKVLLPVVRVKFKKPSHDFAWIPPVEPSTVPYDISSKIIRPPPIAGVVPSRVKKWYTNRVSMGVDKGKQTPSSSENDKKKRQDEALEFLQHSNLEKTISLEKRNN